MYEKFELSTIIILDIFLPNLLKSLIYRLLCLIHESLYSLYYIKLSISNIFINCSAYILDDAVNITISYYLCNFNKKYFNPGLHDVYIAYDLSLNVTYDIIS